MTESWRVSASRLLQLGKTAALATLALAGTLLVSAPAAARPGYGGHGGYVHGYGPGWPRAHPGYFYRGTGWGYRGYPRGWVGGLPLLATVVTIGGLSYWYADGLYYRAAPVGGYEVVSPPQAAQAAGPVANDRFYVYPRQAQTAEQQASDEYECHRWAAQQSGFDPTVTATGGGSDASRNDDYRRAQAACLDGRGYTVR